MKICTFPRVALRLLAASLLTLTASLPFAVSSAQAARVGKATTLHNFTGTDGSAPSDAPIKATDGNFYGVVRGGGINDGGIIYKLTPAGVFSVLHTFQNDSDVNSEREGIEPAALIQGKDGNLYGVCHDGGAQVTDRFPIPGGTFFKLSLSGTFTKLYDFDTGQENTPDFPTAIVQSADGNFYGLTQYGGKTGFDKGTYFRLSSNGKTLTELYAFNASNRTAGYDPLVQLTVGKDGNFYGVTSFGGSIDGTQAATGTIFKATTAGTITVLHPFFTDDFNDNPQDVEDPLVQGTDGNLYGTSLNGGVPGKGTVFCYHLNDGSFTIVHEFKGGSVDGESPHGLTLGSDGNFYGVTFEGFPTSNANLGPGSYFQLTPGGTLTSLAHLDGSASTGAVNPAGGLTEIGNLVFAGATVRGGTSSNGTLVKLVVSPVITSATTASIGVGQTFSYSIRTAGAATSFAASGVPAGLTFNASTGTLTGKPTAAGTYKITLAVANSAGSSSVVLTLTVKPPAPVITSSLTGTATVGVAYSYQITASNSPTSYGAASLPGGLSLSTSTGKITGTPTTAGTFSVTIAAFNSGGSGSAKLALTVKVATKPVVTSAGTATGQVGKAFAYSITATNSPTKYGASGLPSGLTINQTTGKITGTPTKAGTFSVTIAAFNASGSGTKTLTLTVKVASPVVTSSSTATGKVGTAFSYQITATNTPTSYGASGLPSGLSVNQTTGKISGTPTKAGSYSVTIAAFNSGGSGTKTLALKIN